MLGTKLVVAIITFKRQVLFFSTICAVKLHKITKDLLYKLVLEEQFLVIALHNMITDQQNIFTQYTVINNRFSK